MGDVYSYVIMLMETFTRKKPTDDLFVGELTMKKWVSESFFQAVLSIVDSNFLIGEEEDFSEKGSCLSMIMEVALNCTEDSTDERINMKDVADTSIIEQVVVTVVGGRLGGGEVEPWPWGLTAEGAV
ncbi:hypothetical protein RJ640_001694 [Escallonia rubra]|uniref:Uncharacterized protein n=1 Tax=Escallonia rubra TaxID=112253 RepID=A0AA88QS64_9ASTE|nr:hypothetical protein RJ640_001694 [Escallonia rubra]